MADNKKHIFNKLLLLALFSAALLVQDVTGSRVQIAFNNHLPAAFKNNWKRLLIGSVAPVCSYNECKGCKYKSCRAEQVPVDANDPINTAYHYKCVCQR